MRANLGILDADSISSERLRREIFRYSVGDPVLLSRAAGSGKKLFDKPSVLGTFERDARYEVVAASLRPTRGDEHLVPGSGGGGCDARSQQAHSLLLFFSVYKLKNAETSRRLAGVFYEPELKPLPGDYDDD